MNRQELETAIAEIEENLNSGVRRVSADGTTTDVDLDQQQRRLNDLKRQLNATRPTTMRVNLGHGV